MTSTATDPRPPYLPRHARNEFQADPAQTGACDLLTHMPCPHWRRQVFDLFMSVSPAKHGRHHAPETDGAISLTDEFLAVRGAYLASRTGGPKLTGSWDSAAINFLGILGLFS